MNKTKQISKKEKKQKQKKVHDEQGNPILNHLSDFVISIKSVYDSKAIYTGGRILTSNNKIYASCNDQIHVYSTTDNKIIDTIKHNNEAINNFIVCPHEKYIVTFTNNYLLRVIHLENKKLIHTVRIDKYFAFDMSFSKNENLLAIGCVNSFVKIFTFNTMKETHNYKHHSFCVKKVAWHPNPDNLQIISVDEEANLVIFDYILNKVVSKAEKAGKNFVLTPKGTNIITSHDQAIKVFDYQGLKLQYTVPLKQYIDAIYLLGNDQLLFGGQQTELYKLDLNSAEHTITKIKNGTQNGVMKILPVHNKQIMVVSLQQNLHFLDKESLEKKSILAGFNDQIIDLKYSKGQQSKYYLMATNSNIVKLMDRETHQIVSLIDGHKEIVLTVEYYHPYAITSGKDKIIKLWKISDHGHAKLIANYRGHLEDITSVAFMAEEKIIVSVSQDKTIKIWAMCTQSDQKIQIKSSLFTIMAHNKSINSVKVFQKQNLIATCSQDRTVKIWHWENNVLKLVYTLAGHKRGVWDCIFHPIQKLLVSVSGDGMMKGWNLINGQCLWSMGQGQGLLRCAWLYHNQVITGSFDGIIKIWDIRKQTSTSYDKHGGKIWALDVIRDHNDKCEIMSGDNDSNFCVWKDNTQQVRNNIISGLQHDQEQKANYKQYMHEKKFIEAAKVAFEGNYTQLFINAVTSMFCTFDENSEIKQKEEGIIDCEQELEVVPEVQLKALIKELMQIDLSRLLQIIKSMNSTVKHFKIANKILFNLLQLKSWKQWQQFDKQFIMIDKNEKMIDESAERKSDFERFIENMMLLTEKHYNRMEKYKKNSYWFDYVQERRGIV